MKSSKESSPIYSPEYEKTINYIQQETKVEELNPNLIKEMQTMLLYYNQSHYSRFKTINIKAYLLFQSDQEMAILKCFEGMIDGQPNFEEGFIKLIQFTLVQLGSINNINKQEELRELSFNLLFFIKLCFNRMLNSVYFEDLLCLLEEDKDNYELPIHLLNEVNKQSTLELENKYQLQLFIKWMLKLMVQIDLSYQINIQTFQTCINILFILFSFECPKLLNNQINPSSNLIFNFLLVLDNLWLERLSLNLIQSFFYPLNSKDTQGLFKSAYSYLFTNINEKPNNNSFQSIQLFLFLCFHYNHNDNPFLNVITKYFDLLPLFPNPPFLHLNPSSFYQKALSLLDEVEGLLLFYLFLNHNVEFQSYIHSLTDPSELVLICCKGIYESTIKKESDNKAYLYTIILLFCSQSDGFLRNMCNLEIMPPIWLNSRLIMELPLSDFILHILIKYCSHHLNEPRDQFGYSLGISTLVNTIPYFNHMTSLLVQKLFSFLELINKKRIQLGQNVSRDRDEKLNGINVYEEVLCLLFYSISQHIRIQNHNATNMFYGLLQNIELVNMFEEHPFISKYCKPLILVINPFLNILNEASQNSLITVEHISNKIKQMLLSCPLHLLEMEQTISFQYQNHDDNSIFFKLLLWPQVHRNAYFVLNSNIILDMININWNV